MKNPHSLSAVHILDLGCSPDTRVPSGAGSSLYGEGDGTGQPWLYAPGDLEAHLMAEARAFRIDCGMQPPGYSLE